MKEVSDAATAHRIALTVAAAFFMETLDASIIVTALPAIAADYGISPLDASLSVTVYLVAMCIGIPASAWLAERIGARRLFASAVGLFTLASLLCALAPSFGSLVAARILQGTAAAFMSPVGRVVVLRETPQARIIEALTVITWPGLIGPVLGPPLGGLIASHGSWRWIFLVNLPLGLAGLWFIARLFPRRSGETRPAPFDFTGFLWTGTALGALVLGFTRLGEGHGSLPLTLTLLGAGAVAAFAAVRHARRAAAPMLDLRALATPTFAVAAGAAGLLSRVAINASPFLLPLMFQVGFGMSAVNAGIMVLVYMVGNLGIRTVSTRILRRWGFRPVMLVNGVLCVLCLFGCSLLTAATPMALVLPLLLAAGITRSINFTSLTALTFADVPDTQRPGASALASMVQQVALAVGVAMAATALGASRLLRGAPHLEAVDFRHAWWVMTLMMGVSVLLMRRLAADAGRNLSTRAA